jgi:hypothetical protein
MAGTRVGVMLAPVIPATWEAEIGRIRASLGKKLVGPPSQQNKPGIAAHTLGKDIRSYLKSKEKRANSMA